MIFLTNSLFDFATDIISIKGKGETPGVGSCGGQLRPRFFERTDKDEPYWNMQGFALPAPAGGRAVRYAPVAIRTDGNSVYSAETTVDSPLGRLQRKKVSRSINCRFLFHIVSTARLLNSQLITTRKFTRSTVICISAKTPFAIQHKQGKSNLVVYTEVQMYWAHYDGWTKNVVCLNIN